MQKYDRPIFNYQEDQSISIGMIRERHLLDL